MGCPRAAHPALATGTSLAVKSDMPAVLARLRVAPTETALVLTNAGTTAASPTLSLDAGPLCGSPVATAALGGRDGVIAPTITATGGFADYRPVAAIPAQSSVVLTFASR